MGKYRSSATRREKPVKQGPHFVWRGLGCLMMIIIPVISFASAFELVKFGLAKGWPIPYQLLGTPKLPEIVYKVDGLWLIFGRLTGIQHLYAYASIGILIMIMLSGLISVIYAAIYQALGPSRWGPMDMPPPKFRPKKYTR
ncbi:MAG: hypothetical protein IPO22_19960 [Anaerolineales bacterium]|jgi:hypothetical protein|nr:hypothetical protein [Anaerolineales bacterium]